MELKENYCECDIKKIKRFLLTEEFQKEWFHTVLDSDEVLAKNKDGYTISNTLLAKIKIPICEGSMNLIGQMILDTVRRPSVDWKIAYYDEDGRYVIDRQKHAPAELIGDQILNYQFKGIDIECTYFQEKWKT